MNPAMFNTLSLEQLLEKDREKYLVDALFSEQLRNLLA